jgi:hypothetical protein
MYLKNHSRGEYVFDHGWANAFENAGGRYYPKLQCSVPFTPATGPRLLTPNSPAREAVEDTLIAGAIEVGKRMDVSSLHITFLPERQWTRLGSRGLLQRTDQQFHWHNRGYGSFDDFLADLSSRKRKMIRKERALEHHPFLHFECCYYQAIEFAIEKGLARVEAGAQGEHKLARGYLPARTYSAHWIANSSFREAVAEYLSRERQYVDRDIAALGEYAPFRHDTTGEEHQEDDF